MSSKFRHLRKLIKKDKVTIVEVGCHWGQDTVRFMQTFKNVYINCFEPNPHGMIIAKSLIKSIEQGNQIKVFGHPLEFGEVLINFHEKAVSDKNSKMDFHCTYRDPRESDKKETERTLVGDVTIAYQDFIKPYVIASDGSSLNEIIKDDVEYKTITVETITLDSWFSDEIACKEVDLLWIDAQGHEKQVILGATEMLKKTDFVIMEVGENKQYAGAMTEEQTVELMKGYSFKKIKKFQSDCLFEREK